jgi:hypothetical protein
MTGSLTSVFDPMNEYAQMTRKSMTAVVAGL